VLRDLKDTKMKHTAKLLRAAWRSARTFGLAGLLLLGVGTAWANVNILVVNNSFETLPAGGLTLGCGTNCSYSVGAIPGWTRSGDSGQFQPGPPATLAYFNNVPDGVTVAYSNVILGTISQTVGQTVQAGITYTLSVYLGNRNDGYNNQGSAGLRINGNLYLATGIQAAPGEWTQWTATYTPTNPLDIGKSITIELNSLGPQGDYDNVVLSATPEPGFYGALALGMSGLLVVIQRRRRA
jgi:hypothetical protein